MKFFVTSLILLFIINWLPAQETEWGKIDPADLKMTVYEQDSSAAAVILLDAGEVKLDLSNRSARSVLKRYVRIKILDKSGLDRGDISIPNHEDYHYLHDIKLQTVLPSGKRYPISKDDIFVENLENGWRLTKIAAPQLSVGSIIEYQYTLETKSISTLPTWYFQTDIPTHKSTLDAYLPSWVNYVFIVNKPKALSQKELNDQFDGTTSGKHAVRYHRYFLAENLPAIKEEAYVTDIDDHRAKIQFQLSEYAPPSGGYYKYLENWETTANELLDDADLGRQFTKKSYAKNLRAKAIELTRGIHDSNEKLAIIYRFLQQKIEWNGRYRLYAKTKLDDNFVKGKANSGELNMMAIAMLNAVGIPAHPILISTRSHGKPIVDYPIVNQFNHLVILAQADGKEHLLDLTNPYRPIGYLSVEALNGKAFLLKPDNSQWIQINPKNGKDIIAANLELSPDGLLTGEMKTRCIGNSAVSEREQLAKYPAGNFWVDRLDKQFTEVEINEMAFQNAADLNKPLSNSFNIEIGDAAQVVDDFIYLNPTIYSNFLENPFKLERREYPVEIPYPFQQQTILNLKLPAGYEVAELPEDAKMVLPENGGELLYSITEKAGSIQLTTRIEVNQLIHQPHEYPNLKMFFDLIIEKQGEQIVLKRTSNE